MKKILALTVSILVLNCTFVSAKKFKLVAPDTQPRTELKIADKFYAESYFYTAAEHYRDVVRQDSSNRYANFGLAMSLLMSRDYVNAEIFFRQFYNIKPGEKANAKKWADEDKILFNKGEYFFGDVLHRNGKYDEAITHLTKFAQNYTPKDSTDNLKKLAMLQAAGCEFAKTGPKAKVKFFNAGHGVNKAYNNDGPFAVNENEIYYSSLRNGNDTLIFVNGNNKAQAIYAIKHSVKNGESWSEGTIVDNKDINTDGYNVGNGTFNQAMNRFYFTKCLEVDDRRPLCNIFVADYSGGKFSNVTRLPETVNAKEKYTSTQPAVRVADDGTEMLYFVSDRPGGSGGLDIWYTARLQNGDFKPAMHVNSGINTAGDEVTPFFDDSTRTLYFSSNGLPGYGGFDIFRSTENPDLSWTSPENLGKGINSGADDIYYSRGLDQTNGFMVSNREGGFPLNGIKTSSDDIYYWTNYRLAVEGLAMKEGENGGIITNATFKLYKKMPDGTKVLISVQDGPQGTAHAPGVAPRTSASSGSNPGNGAAGGNNSSTGGNTSAANTGSSNGAYFFRLDPETDYVVEVDREGFQPKMENVSTRGMEEDTIKDNIYTHKAMYTVKGLVTEEGKLDGLTDASVELLEISPNGMQKTNNFMKSNPYYAFDLDMDRTYKIVIRKEGYFAKTTDLSTIGLGTMDTIRKDISIAKLELNKSYTLQNVLYEFGKSTLTENSKAVLDNLYQILVENPSFIIELSAHTDAIGSDEGNMKLSQARAESCVAYLITKGVAKDRMVAKGYGKTRPKVPNTTEDGKDDPAGRAINRRTEFQITGIKKSQ